jgi:hypothetical protein
MTRLLAVTIALFAAAAPAAAAQTQLVHVSNGAAADLAIAPTLHTVAHASGRAFISTAEPLLPGLDTDASTDVYARDGDGTLLMLSDGPSVVDPSLPATFRGASADGSRVFIATEEAMLGSDTDAVLDAYARDVGGSYTHVSDPPGGGTDAAIGANFSPVAIPADGERLIFLTSESMDAADTDTARDLYARDPDGTLTLVSDGSAVDDPDLDVDPEAVSPDGQRIVMESAESLAASDTDTVFDVYVRTGTGPAVHVSDSQGAGADPALHAAFHAASENADRVVISTEEALLPSDGDSVRDVYSSTIGGLVSHVSDGTTAAPDATLTAGFTGASPDAKRVLFDTTESLVPGDADPVGGDGDPGSDVYSRNPDGTLTAISDGPGPDADGDAFLDALSPDGATVLFETAESLAASDQDTKFDAYLRAADGSVTHVSDGPGADGPFDAFGNVVANGGAQSFFGTEEPLAASDNDGAFDDYARGRQGGLTHVSDAGAGDSNADSVVREISPDGSRAYLYTDEPLLPTDTDSARDVYAVFGIADVPPPAGPGSPGSGGPGAAPPPPGGGALAAASRLSLTPSAFRAARGGPSVVAGPSVFSRRSARPAAFGRAPRRRAGATIRYRLTAAARVRFTVERRVSGRRVRGRCVEPRRSNRRRPRCARFVTVRGSFAHDGAAGANSLRFSGRVSGRRLAPGRYRLVATPRGGGRAARASFRIVR